MSTTLRFSILLLLTCSGCRQTAPEPSMSSELPAIRTHLLSIAPLPVRENYDIISASTEYDVTNPDGVRLVCRTDAHDLSNSFESIAAFDPHVDALWPGSLVQGLNLQQGQLAPIVLDRAPGTITLTSLSLSDDADNDSVGMVYSRSVPRPDLASVHEATQELLRQHNDQPTPARISYQMAQMHSLEQGMLHVGASAQWLTGEARGHLTTTSESGKARFVVRFVQSYYTVSFNPPNAESVFDPSVRLEDFRKYTNVATLAPTEPTVDSSTAFSPPVFISSVTYGRMLLLVVTSSAEASELQAALNASLDALVASGSVEAEARHRQVLNESEIRVLALGGPASSALRVITGDRLEGLRQYLNEGANYSVNSPGVPISYQARYLRDNTTARLSFTTNYNVGQCAQPSPYVPRAEVVIDRLEFHDTADDDEDLDFHVNIDLLKQDGTVAATLNASAADQYVEEPGKVGGWKDGTNRFFRGRRIRAEDPIFSVRVRVRVSTRDGDGKRWGTNEAVFHAPFQPVVQMDGGHDGHWRLFFTVRP